jgi:hypothetical protein
MVSGKRSWFDATTAFSTSIEKLHVDDPALKVNTSVPTLKGVPDATSEMVCNPVAEKLPEPEKL